MYRIYCENQDEVANLHEVLANKLWSYFLECNPTRGLVTNSQFIRDVLLKEHYYFNSLPWIIKHAMTISNPMMVKPIYYRDDQFYVSGGEPEIADDSFENMPLMSTQVKYKTDPAFQTIVECHRSLNAKFVGVSAAKGGLSVIWHIIVDREASFRFLGPLDPGLGREDSAYLHGPYFIVTTESLNGRSRINGVYDFSLSEILFLVPDQKDVATLRNQLEVMQQSGLVKKEFLRCAPWKAEGRGA